jgi:hypothetical protein
MIIDSPCVIAEAVGTLAVAPVEAAAAVVLVGEQIDAAPAAAHAPVLAHLVAASAVVRAGLRVHALPVAARRPGAAGRQAHGGRFLGAAVRRQQGRRRCDFISEQETAPPGSEVWDGGGAVSEGRGSCGRRCQEHRQ